MIAASDDELRIKLTDILSRLFTQSLIVHAKDGVEAEFKISNDLPHVVLVDQALPKINGLKLVERLLERNEEKKVAAIIMTQIPDAEHFVDEVATGRVQFLDSVFDEKKISEYVNRAINYSSGKAQAQLETKRLKQGEVLLREGEKGEFVYILRQGKLKAYRQENGQEVELGDVEAGEFVGEMSYINGEPRSATVKAEGDCELVVIPMGLLDNVLFMKPAWAKALMKTLSKRVKSANETKS